eukprot:367924-Amphidinium_carterae.3
MSLHGFVLSVLLRHHPTGTARCRVIASIVVVMSMCVMPRCSQVVTMDVVERELRTAGDVICDVDIQGTRCSHCEQLHSTLNGCLESQSQLCHDSVVPPLSPVG